MKATCVTTAAEPADLELACSATAGTATQPVAKS